MLHIQKIDSFDAPELQPYVTMKRPLEHERQGIFVAEGVKVVKRLLESRFAVLSVVLPEKWLDDFRPLFEARPEQITVYLAEKKFLETLVGFSMFQGVLAVGKIPPPVSLDDILSKNQKPLLLVAVDALRRLGLKPHRPIIGLWTSDEEIGSHASRKLIEHEARRSAAVLVLEPAARKGGKLKTARKGVGEVTLEVTGRAAHAGLDPQNGINAIEELALQIARIRSFNQPQSGITVNADVIAGGTRSNVIAESAHAIVDVRAETARDILALEKKFRALRPILPGAKLKVTGGFNRPPLERRMSAGLFAEAKRIGQILGLHIDECAVGGGSDGCFTAALGVPTLDGLGGVGDGAHAANEHVLLRALPERAALLAALLLEL